MDAPLNNCTLAAICSSAAKDEEQNNTIQLVIVIIATLNTILTMAAPYVLKLKAVQEVLYPDRTSHKAEMKKKIQSAIAVLEDTVKSLSSDRSADSARKTSVDVVLG